jgi:integrase
VGGSTGRPRAASSLNRDLAPFRAALNHAFENRVATSNAAWRTSLKAIRNANGRRNVYLDAGQRQQLVHAAPADMAAFVRGLCLVPLRPGALAAMTVADFDRRLGVLTIGKDKTGKGRQIKLPDDTTAFFALHSKGKLPAAPLLARADGSHWSKDSWKKPFKCAVLEAGITVPATAYTLRHSTITDLVFHHGLDLMSVAILSDTSIAMIEKHYGHLVGERSVEALSKLAL